MDPASTRARRPPLSAASELRQLGDRRRDLLAQAVSMGVSFVALVLGAGGLDGAPKDLQFLFLAVTGLYSLAAIHVVDELVAMLHAECPRCASRFFGNVPERVPSPLRSRCCHCGLELGEEATPPIA